MGSTPTPALSLSTCVQNKYVLQWVYQKTASELHWVLTDTTVVLFEDNHINTLYRVFLCGCTHC